MRIWSARRGLQAARADVNGKLVPLHSVYGIARRGRMDHMTSSQRSVQMPRVTVSGPAGLVSYDFGRNPITIGRGSGNSIALEDGQLSRQHCVFEPVGNSWRLRDLGSRNGTRVNGQAVQTVELRPGDTVQCGSHEIQLAEVGGAAPVSPAEGGVRAGVGRTITPLHDSATTAIAGVGGKSTSVAGRVAERLANNGGVVRLYGGWGCFGAIAGPVIGIVLSIAAFQKGHFPWWGFLVAAASIPVFWILLPICLYCFRAYHEWRRPDVIIATKEKMAEELFWARYGGSLGGIFIAGLIAAAPSIWIAWRYEPVARQAAIASQTVEFSERLVAPPPLAVRSSSNQDASSWGEFIDWYNSARECGGINFPTADASGKAMYDIVDLSTERGRVMAEARRKLAIEEWNTAAELRKCFPNATDSEYRAVLAAVFFQAGGYQSSDGKWGWRRVQDQVSRNAIGRFVNAMSSDWFLGLPDERKQDGSYFMTHLIVCGVKPAPRTNDDCQTTALIRTHEGVRIDPYGVRVGYEVIRVRDTGALNPAIVEAQPSTVEVALQGAAPWFRYLATVRQLAASERIGGDINEFMFALREEVQVGARSEGPEAGWTFNLATLVERR